MVYKVFLKRKESHWLDYYGHGKTVTENPFVDYSLKYIGKKDRILEVGAGDGRVLEILKKKGYKDVYGIEYKKENVKKAKEKKLNVILADMRKLPYPDDYFKAYYDLGVLEHLEDIEDQKKAIREAYRVVKEGGYCFIAEGFFTGFRKLVFPAMVIKNLYRRYFGGGVFHEYVYTKRQLTTLVKNAGFSIVGTYDNDTNLMVIGQKRR